MADFVILAEKAEKVTMGKEDRSRSIDSYERVFFAKMRAVTRDYGPYPCTTIPRFIGGAVYLTVARAKTAGFQNGPDFRNSTLEYSFFVQL
jgi:hypothetical protein